MYFTTPHNHTEVITIRMRSSGRGLFKYLRVALWLNQTNPTPDYTVLGKIIW